MKLDIEKVASHAAGDKVEVYQITTPVEVRQEEEIRYNTVIRKLIANDDYSFKRSESSTMKWELCISRRADGSVGGTGVEENFQLTMNYVIR